ncbi:MAG: DUF4340 domain-containing protein [Treponema sp.]|jgi:hypothetical protein|nr:DUF4340 domain-containing protein [Treponema sp.]
MADEKKSGGGRGAKKIYTLAGISGILVVVYLLTVFFDSGRVNARGASFTWLSPEAQDMADRIEISRPGNETLVIRRINDAWFAVLGGGQVPVKQGRIDDLFRVLCTKGTFPRLGSSPSSHEALGLSAERAARLVIRGGAAVPPLIDLLVGEDDSSGREVYLRKNGENEYRSGDRLVKSYVNGGERAWYNLRLFAENRAGMVQRIRMDAPEDGEDFSLARNGNVWAWEPSGETAGEAADAYVRNLFEIQGDTFLSPEAAESLAFDSGGISIELGDGSVITVRAAEEQDGMRPVLVSGSPYVYLLSRPAAERLFRARSTLDY